MMQDYNINDLVNSLDFNSNKLNTINGFLLTNREIEVLEKYKIPYKNCHQLKEVLFEIEEVINDMDIVDEDLDYISYTISERDYYQNTNK